MQRPRVWDDGPVWWQVGAVAAVLLAIAYANGLQGAFVFDDEPAIVKNESIRSLWPLGPVLWTAGDTGRTQDSRPLFNLSLALNYALHGLWRPGFRVVNLVIHVSNVCMLFAVVRRLINLATEPDSRSFSAGRHRWMAAAIALLWAAHPLHTHVVTYIAQRAEALGASCVLAAFLLAIRALSFASLRSAVGAGLIAVLGALAKETTICILPLVAAFDWAWSDRLPVAGERSSLLPIRQTLYACLACNPIILVTLHVFMGGRGDSAGLGTVPVRQYLFTQAEAVWMYLGKTIWPARLVLDHGDTIREHLPDVWPWVLLSVAILCGFIAGFIRHPRTWFPAIALVLLLAPSSSVMPIASQTVAEHRMYLASSSVIAAAALAFVAVTSGRLPYGLWVLVTALLVTIAVGLELTRITVRNRDFATAVSLWTQNVRDCPRNVRGLTNLAGLFILDQRYDEAADVYRWAGRLPDLKIAAAAGLGDVRRRQGRWDEAAAAYRDALGGGEARSEGQLSATVGLAACALHEAAPDAVIALTDLASSSAWHGIRMPAGERWKLLGRAIAYRAAALRRLNAGRPDDGCDACMHFLAEHPSAADAMARACDEVGEFTAAARLWEPLAAVDPSLLANLAVSRINAGHIDGAIEAFERAVAAYPDDPGMRANLDQARKIARRHAGNVTNSDPP